MEAARQLFTERLTADRVEPGRYRLIVSLACPWAHRSLILRGLLGLEDVLPLGVVDSIRDEKGWRFTLDPDGRDPVLGIRYLSEAYEATDPSFQGRVTAPRASVTRTRARSSRTTFLSSRRTCRPSGRPTTVMVRRTSIPRRCGRRWTR